MAEHYEIVSYGNMIKLANALGYDDPASILNQTLSEEKEADALLTQVAEQDVNNKIGSETHA